MTKLCLSECYKRDEIGIQLDHHCATWERKGIVSSHFTHLFGYVEKRLAFKKVWWIFLISLTNSKTRLVGRGKLNVDLSCLLGILLPISSLQRHMPRVTVRILPSRLNSISPNFKSSLHDWWIKSYCEVVFHVYHKIFIVSCFVSDLVEQLEGKWRLPSHFPAKAVWYEVSSF